MDAGASSSAQVQHLHANASKMPLYFIENQGQLDARVGYYLRGHDTSVYFTPQGIIYALTGSSTATTATTATIAGQAGRSKTARPEKQLQTAAPQRWAVAVDFVGANPSARPVGERPTSAVVSYFHGSQTDWQVGVPTFASVRYADLWPGIDLVYEGTSNQLKYTFLVRPGADPHQIKLAYRGASAVALTPTGQLEVRTPVQTFREDVPYVYQEEGEQRTTVSARYIQEQTGPDGSLIYGFDLGAYDTSRPLVLDPVVFVYVGYIGGASEDLGAAIAVDGSGNAYVTGVTFSDESSFPVTVGPDMTDNGSSDAFVVEVNPSGTALIYASYIGGMSGEEGHDIAVDKFGNAYIIGDTGSDEKSFPVTVGPDLTYNGGDDVFVAEVQRLGAGLVYAGYIGGSSSDRGVSIALDEKGGAYVTGDTSSTQASFPVTAGPDLTYNGGFSDAFVASVNPGGTGLVYAGYIGGADTDTGDGIAVDTSGNAYVAGKTSSSEKSFPVTVGPDLTYNGGFSDVYVAKVAATGTSLVYAGYIGGNDEDVASGIALDIKGNAFVTGSTLSTEATFPVTVGPDLTFNGGLLDAFVAMVSASGSAPLIYCGYIGGLGAFGEGGNDIAVDSAGSAYVVGNTPADQTTFPVAVGPDVTFNGEEDAFIAKVRPNGTGLMYAGYIGGAGDDSASGVAVDKFGAAYVTGETDSDETTFPVLTGPDKIFNGDIDGFVAKINVIIPPPTTPIVIRPGSGIAPIAPRSRGTIPVALLSTDEFTATQIDLQSVRFGAKGSEAAPRRAIEEDVDGDGLTDLLLFFETQETGIRCGDNSATLTGKTLDGQSISGSDAIRTVGCPQK